jgi:hypothetical protein
VATVESNRYFWPGEGSGCEIKIIFNGFPLLSKIQLFLWYFRLPKLLLPIFPSRRYVGAKISLAGEINIHLFSAAGEQDIEKYMNLFLAA